MSKERIAKNSLLLYIRTFFVMILSLYSSRIVLKVLGFEDYGLYNVISGFVIMLSFLNSSMSNATQRFISYELGKGEFEKLRETFSILISIHFFLAFIVLLIAETIGLWFLNTQLNIVPERIFAANVVYQFSILTLIIGVISVPYSSLIIAHERMAFFAFINIFDVSLKLLFVIILQYLPLDKLIFYAFLTFFVTLSVRVLYAAYCGRNFPESSYSLCYKRKNAQDILSFASWSLFGSIATLGHTQGVNVILNIFLGATINAARGISYQIQTALTQFVMSFQTAMNPQIVKKYANGNLNETFQLVFLGSKFSFYILFLITLPFFIEMPHVLEIWLGSVPEYTVVFSRLILINTLIVSLSGSLSMLAQATGKIKKYQMTMGGILLLNIPLSYIYMKVGFSPEITFTISICLEIIALFFRLYILKIMISFPVFLFIKKVLLKAILVTSLSLVVMLFLFYIYPFSGISRFFLVIIFVILFLLPLLYLCGMDKSERFFVMQKIRSVNSKIRKFEKKK